MKSCLRRLGYKEKYKSISGQGKIPARERPLQCNSASSGMQHAPQVQTQ